MLYDENNENNENNDIGLIISEAGVGNIYR